MGVTSETNEMKKERKKEGGKREGKRRRRREEKQSCGSHEGKKSHYCWIFLQSN